MSGIYTSVLTQEEGDFLAATALIEQIPEVRLAALVEMHIQIANRSRYATLWQRSSNMLRLRPWKRAGMLLALSLCSVAQKGTRGLCTSVACVTNQQHTPPSGSSAVSIPFVLRTSAVRHAFWPRTFLSPTATHWCHAASFTYQTCSTSLKSVPFVWKSGLAVPLLPFLHVITSFVSYAPVPISTCSCVITRAIPGHLNASSQVATSQPC